jgi:hypothetical protein
MNIIEYFILFILLAFLFIMPSSQFVILMLFVAFFIFIVKILFFPSEKNDSDLHHPLPEIPDTDTKQLKSLTQQICGSVRNGSCGNHLSQFSPFPQYEETPWSLLDAVPPPDPFHEYRCDGFNREQTNKTDYERWKSEWQPNEDYSIKYLDLSNDFYL